MSTWGTERILAESAKWYWVPPGATEVETEEIHLYVHAGAATLIRAQTDAAARQSNGDTRGLIRRVANLARRHGADRVMWSVGPNPEPADVVDVLHSLGGEVSVNLDVCAYDISSGLPYIPVPDDVTARGVTSADDMRAALTVGSAVWGGEEPSAEDIDKEFANRGDGPGFFVAFHAGEPAGSGGYTLAGSVARLWGAGVLPALRGNGVYRALLDARLRDAIARGAELALVHANVGTSGPILRRLGFTAYGQRQIIALLIR